MGSKGITRHFLFRFEYAAIIFLSAIFRTLPRSALYGFARFLGLLAFHCIRIRRDLVMDNLWHSFGAAVPEHDLAKLAREVYINVGVTFAEMLLFPGLSHRLLDMVDMTELEVLRDACGRGKGVILISGHFGNWELNGSSIALSGIPVVVVAKRQSNPYVDAWITRYRKEFRMNIISPGAPVKHLIRALRNGEAVGLISDQDAGKRGVFVPFFGRPASTPRGAAELALRYGASVVVCMTVRLGPGKNKTLFREIEVHSNDTVESLTARYTSVMEDIIRTYPEQYFWMHRRWKTRPVPGTDDGNGMAENRFGEAE